MDSESPFYAGSVYRLRSLAISNSCCSPGLLLRRTGANNSWAHENFRFDENENSSLCRSILRWKFSLVKHLCIDKSSCKETFLSSNLPGIPRHKSPVQHFLGSKQIPEVAHLLHFPISTRVVERFIWIFLLVSGSDISQHFLCLCNPSFKQQVPWRLRNKPESKEPRQGLPF